MNDEQLLDDHEVIAVLLITELLLQIHRKKRILQYLLTTPTVTLGHSSRKWRWLVRSVKTKPKYKRRSKELLPRNRWGPLEQTGYNRYLHTGVLSAQFRMIFQLIEDDLKLPRSKRADRTKIRSNSLRPQARLALVLTYLRNGQKSTKNIMLNYGVNRPYISREVRHVAPILASRCMFIRSPVSWTPHQFVNAVGAIDCTSHYRCRTHPNQHLFYRGDKRAHFITAQVVCSLTGVIQSVNFFPGHMNDQGVFSLSGWQAKLQQEGIILLADGGYCDLNLVTPNDDRSKQWNDEQKALRSVVEHTNSVIHGWGYASECVRGHSPELHACCLLVIYNLSNLMLLELPLRSNAFLARFPACEQ